MWNLEIFEKIVDSLEIIWKIGQKRSNSPNFLLKYLENIENFEENQLPFFKEK